MQIKERFERFMERVRESAIKAKRNPEEIKVIAVSKTFPVSLIEELYSLGHRDFGENYVQEAREKIKKLVEKDITWHMVGSLQKNKAKYMPDLFQWFHSLDSIELLELLSKNYEKKQKKLNLLIQVDLYGKDKGRAGIEEEKLKELAERCLSHPSINLKGLMVLPPPPSHPEDSRPYFRRLRELKDELIKSGIPEECMSELSMGMSDDFEVAIEEGATMLRIGRAIFGERNV